MRLLDAIAPLRSVLVLAALAGASSGAQTPEGREEARSRIAQYPEAPLEDRDGNLWFCTAFEGLIRFDGEEFTTFTTADGLGDDTARGILEDQDGTLWIATAGGLTRYDGETFTTLTDYADPVTAAGGFGEHGHHRDLWDVMRDSRGRLWIATLDGVFWLEGETLVRLELPVLGVQEKYEFTPRMVYSVFEDKDGALWFGTDGAGAVRYDGKTPVAYTTQDGLCSDHVARIVQDPRGHYWFGTSNGGVSHFDGETFTTHLRNDTFSEHNGWGRFLGILVDRDGNVWFGRSSPGGGVYRHDGESFRYYSEEEGVGPGGVIAVREDRSGRIWLGTTSGVYRLDGERFETFSRD